MGACRGEEEGSRKVGERRWRSDRATQHYAIDDYGKQPRRVQRVTLVGNLSVSIDGKHSEAIKGNSATYTRSLVTA
ncbi:hypothetical protein H6G89_19325 [Oscillatoria sp. FACHB-1407]|uniref:hypothetical protein n=1 Tax=Oscillatoria sp. FACHB-1407 TaxID=2692847 RepID=UPI001686AE9C|nr:hypothetical protein [Oscillatoria sp. FACHB-1407]MBD2463191.1 hypothetical protein [Oscillatoria sp. FACHB-1407]